MPDYRFTFYKTIDVVFEAGTEHDAWVQAMTFDPNLLATDWDVKLNDSIAPAPQPLDQGPVEVDDWDFDSNDVPQ